MNETDFLCPDVTDLELFGTFSDGFHSYFVFELLECIEEVLNQMPGYEDAKCATMAEKTRFFATHLLTGVVTNSYVDSSDYDTPIKTLPDYIFNEQIINFTAQTRRQVTLNYNKAKFNDAHFQFSDTLEARNETFISLDLVTEMNIQSYNPGTMFLA